MARDIISTCSQRKKSSAWTTPLSANILSNNNSLSIPSSIIFCLMLLLRWRIHNTCPDSGNAVLMEFTNAASSLVPNTGSSVASLISFIRRWLKKLLKLSKSLLSWMKIFHYGNIHANPQETKSGRGEGLGVLAPPPNNFFSGRKMVHSVAFWI